MSKFNSTKDSATVYDFPSLTGQVDFNTVEIGVHFNFLLEKYAAAYAGNLLWNMVRIDQNDAEAVREHMLQYLQTLVAIRCNMTAKEKSSLPQWLRGKRYFAIPPLVNLLVQHVGYVYDPSLGLELYPSPVFEERFLDQENFELIERVIRATPGSDYATEFPVSKRGDWSTMSICIIDEQVKGASVDIPGVHAVVAAFLGLSGLENILNPRVTYGSLDYFSTYVGKLAELKVC